jgi:isoleucyl-tRNA synthetase
LARLFEALHHVQAGIHRERWWILKQLDNKGLIYKGYKSVPYCPRCGTALSSHEVAQGYEDVKDPSLYFIAPWQNDPEGRAFLVWTTTPWTLPSNIALAFTRAQSTQRLNSRTQICARGVARARPCSAMTQRLRDGIPRVN